MVGEVLEDHAHALADRHLGLGLGREVGPEEVPDDPQRLVFRGGVAKVHGAETEW